MSDNKDYAAEQEAYLNSPVNDYELRELELSANPFHWKVATHIRRLHKMLEDGIREDAVLEYWVDAANRRGEQLEAANRHIHELEAIQRREQYELSGYMRFTSDANPPVVAEVISRFDDEQADDSDIPIYRLPGETKLLRDERIQQERNDG